MYILAYLYILPEVSAFHLQLKCMGGHFFPGHPYIENTTILSDIHFLCYQVLYSINHCTCVVLCTYNINTYHHILL